MLNDQDLQLLKELEEISSNQSVPDFSSLEALVEKATDQLQALHGNIRPLNSVSRPGGLVMLLPAEKTLIVTDLHARKEYLEKVLLYPITSEMNVFQALCEDRINLVCLGDAFHGETRARDRWKRAQDEFLTGFKKHQAMDEEMGENLGLLKMICLLLNRFPTRFFFLKGNHENIANEQGEGNHPFRKYAFEGEMVKAWVEIFMGQEGLKTLYLYEKALPLMAQGPGFLITHCEPGIALEPQDVIDCYLDPAVIYNLTWVANDQADENSVPETLEAFFPEDDQTKIFGGHRPVQGTFSLRQGGRFIQFNRPDAYLLAVVEEISLFDPENDIIVL